MDNRTFEFLTPTPEQKAQMERCRAAAAAFAAVLEGSVPDGPDRDHMFRLLRESAMWANIAITRDPNGAPRVTR